MPQVLEILGLEESTLTDVMSRQFVAQEAALGARELIEYCYEQGWTDGLPVVPPIQEFVDEFPGPDQPRSGRSPDGSEPPGSRVHGASRGDQCDHGRLQARVFSNGPGGDGRVRSGGIARTNLMQSTTGQAEIVIVNGPIRENSGSIRRATSLVRGDRPNATVGRALRLIIMNVLGIRPHEFDQSTQGTSAKYACCIAENEEDSPWEPLHVERGFAASTVTVQMIRSDVYVEHRSTQVPEEILMTIADTMSYGGMITQVTDARMLHGAVVVMGPEHAQLIAARGWSKQDCKQFLFEHLGKYKHELRRMGKLHRRLRSRSGGGVHSGDVVARLDHAGRLAGANNGGVSTVCPSITIGREIGKNATQLIASRQLKAS